MNTSDHKTMIYSYRCDGTMWPEYRCVKVYDNGQVVTEKGWLLEDSKSTRKVQIVPEEIVARIKKVLVENAAIFEIDKIEDGEDIILDGVEETLYFSDGKKEKTIEIDNFWDRRRDREIDNYPNLTLLTKLYREIRKILTMAGIDREYL